MKQPLLAGWDPTGGQTYPPVHSHSVVRMSSGLPETPLGMSSPPQLSASLAASFGDGRLGSRAGGTEGWYHSIFRQEYKAMLLLALMLPLLQQVRQGQDWHRLAPHQP